MRIMLDTNILVSMIFFPSFATRRLKKCLAEKYHIVLCDYVIKELRLVTARKFPDKLKFINLFFLELPYQIVHTPEELDKSIVPVMRDGKDIPILATAILEKVDVLITGDKDFLSLSIKNPKIMTMAEFMEKYG